MHTQKINVKGATETSRMCKTSAAVFTNEVTGKFYAVSVKNLDTFESTDGGVTFHEYPSSALQINRIYTYVENRKITITK